MKLEDIFAEEEFLHKDLVHEFDLVARELTIILDLSAVTFIFPIQLMCRYFAALKTGRQFFMTSADYLDIFVFLLVAWAW